MGCVSAIVAELHREVLAAVEPRGRIDDDVVGGARRVRPSKFASDGAFCGSSSTSAFPGRCRYRSSTASSSGRKSFCGPAITSTAVPTGTSSPSSETGTTS